MMANRISENITDNSLQLNPKVHIKIEGTANDDKNKEGVGDDKKKGNRVMIHWKKEMEKIR